MDEPPSGEIGPNSTSAHTYAQFFSVSCPPTDDDSPLKREDRVSNFASRLALDVFANSTLFSESSHRLLTFSDSLGSRISLSENDLRTAAGGQTTSAVHQALQRKRSRSIAGEESLVKWLAPMSSADERARPPANGGVHCLHGAPISTKAGLQRPSPPISRSEEVKVRRSTGARGGNTDRELNRSTRLSWSGSAFPTTEELQRQTGARYSFPSAEGPEDALFTPSPVNSAETRMKIPPAASPPEERGEPRRKSSRGLRSFFSRLFRGRTKRKDSHQPESHPGEQDAERVDPLDLPPRGGSCPPLEQDDRNRCSPFQRSHRFSRSTRVRRSVRKNLQRIRSFSRRRRSPDRDRSVDKREDERSRSHPRAAGSDSETAVESSKRTDDRNGVSSDEANREDNSHGRLARKPAVLSTIATESPATDGRPPKRERCEPHKEYGQVWSPHQLSSAADPSDPDVVRVARDDQVEDGVAVNVSLHYAQHDKSSSLPDSRRVLYVYPQPLRRGSSTAPSRSLVSMSTAQAEPDPTLFLSETGGKRAKDTTGGTSSDRGEEGDRLNTATSPARQADGAKVVERRPSGNRQLRPMRSRSLHMESTSAAADGSMLAQRLEVPLLPRVAWPESPNTMSHSSTWTSLSLMQNGGDQSDVSQGESTTSVRRWNSQGRSPRNQVIISDGNNTLGARLGVEERSMSKSLTNLKIFKRRGSASPRIGPVDDFGRDRLSDYLSPPSTLRPGQSTGNIPEDQLDGNRPPSFRITSDIARKGSFREAATMREGLDTASSPPPPAPPDLQPPAKPKEELTDEVSFTFLTSASFCAHVHANAAAVIL